MKTRFDTRTRYDVTLVPLRPGSKIFSRSVLNIHEEIFIFVNRVSTYCILQFIFHKSDFVLDSLSFGQIEYLTRTGMSSSIRVTNIHFQGLKSENFEHE